MIRTSKTKLKRPLFDCLSYTATLKSLHELQKPPSPLPDFPLRRTVEKRKEKPYICYVFFLYRLGAHKQSESMGTEQDFTASKIILHPLYHKPIGMSHDIALLKLDRPAALTRWVHSLCIAIPPKYQKCFSRPGAFMDVAWLMLFSDNIPLVLTRIFFFHQSKVSETLVGDDFISPWPKYLNSRH